MLTGFINMPSVGLRVMGVNYLQGWFPWDVVFLRANPVLSMTSSCPCVRKYRGYEGFSQDRRQWWHCHFRWSRTVTSGTWCDRTWWLPHLHWTSKCPAKRLSYLKRRLACVMPFFCAWRYKHLKHVGTIDVLVSTDGLVDRDPDRQNVSSGNQI